MMSEQTMSNNTPHYAARLIRSLLIRSTSVSAITPLAFQRCKSLKGVKCPLGHSPERLGSKLGKRGRLDAVLAL